MAVVAGRLSRDAECDQRSQAADAALDAAGAVGGISAGAASEYEELNAVILGRSRERANPESRDSGSALRASRNDGLFYVYPNLCRASFAPAPSAISLASAMSRCIGAMPQLVVATMLLFGTNFDTASITAATSSAVSTVSLATSITPACTTLPVSKPNRSSGTRELRHSIATCWIGLAAIAGKIFSYCRHSLPSVCFQSVLALMP